jgi:threonine dehydrogenase-like Zn-dependent dehydrogenase
MLQAAPEKFSELITHRLPLDQAGPAFQMLETGDGGAAKIIIKL